MRNKLIKIILGTFIFILLNILQYLSYSFLEARGHLAERFNDPFLKESLTIISCFILSPLGFISSYLSFSLDFSNNFKLLWFCIYLANPILWIYLIFLLLPKLYKGTSKNSLF